MNNGNLLWRIVSAPSLLARQGARVNFLNKTRLLQSANHFATEASALPILLQLIGQRHAVFFATDTNMKANNDNNCCVTVQPETERFFGQFAALAPRSCLRELAL
jgi:hypothetical protein